MPSSCDVSQLPPFLVIIIIIIIQFIKSYTHHRHGLCRAINEYIAFAHFYVSFSTSLSQMILNCLEKLRLTPTPMQFYILYYVKHNVNGSDVISVYRKFIIFRRVYVRARYC